MPDSVGMQTSRERQCLQHCYVSLQVLSVVGLLQDETDPMVSVMKVQSAALASSACVHAIHFNTAAQSVQFGKHCLSYLLRALL